MTRFVVLYAGPTRETARLICTVTDARTVASVARAALKNIPPAKDPVLRELTAGRRRALMMLLDGGEK
jgi:hypothetical protein